DGLELDLQRLRGLFHRLEHVHVHGVITVQKDTHATQARKGLLENLQSFRIESGTKKDDPVTFPPGRARPSTAPIATASPTTPTTMGIVFVARLAASVPGTPWPTNKSR